MKKFLRKVGLLTAAMTMMLSGVAYGADINVSGATNAVVGVANPANKWTLNSAGDNFDDLAEVRQAPTRGGIQKINKGQKFYFQMTSKDCSGGDVSTDCDAAGEGFHTIQDINGTMTAVGCDTDTTNVSTGAAPNGNLARRSSCSSAPLKIAGAGAKLCIDGDLGNQDTSVPAGNVYGVIWACLDDNCSPTTHIIGPLGTNLRVNNNICTETSTTPYQDALQGQTIFVQIFDANTDGESLGRTPTIWIVGH